MNTTYQTPRSELENGSSNTLPPKKFWKFFFWFLLIVQFLSIGLMISDNDPLIEICIDVFIYLFVLIGLFGYAYNKRIFSRAVWRLTIPIALIYDIHSVLTLNIDDIESTAELIVVSSLSFAIIAPMIFAQYLGLFKYAYRSTNIWQ